MYENWDSTEKERPVCRALSVITMIKDHEDKLRKSLETLDFETVNKDLNECQGIDIDVKLRKEAEILHIKLEYELKIRNFLKGKTHHDSYKTIRKDVQQITDTVTKALD